MNSFELNEIPVIGFGGGGTAGKTAAGFMDAVEAGVIPGMNEVDVFVFPGTWDDGGATGDMRKFFSTPTYGLPAVGDIRRTISAVSANRTAADYFEQRFDENATTETVREVGRQLLDALRQTESLENPRILPERATELIDKTLELSYAMYGDTPGYLANIAFGHLVLTALTLESDIDTATRETSDLMQTRAEVIPNSIVNHYLKIRDGKNVIVGEHLIDEHSLENPDDFDIALCTNLDGSSTGVPATPRLLRRLKHADQVVLGPGSPITSTIPAALSEGIPSELQEVKNSPIRELIVLGNLKITSDAEGWNIDKFAKEHGRVIGRNPDAVIANNDIVGIENPVVVNEEDYDSKGRDYEVIVKPIRKSGKAEYKKNDRLAEAGRRSELETDMNAVAIAMVELRLRKLARFAALISA